MKPPVSTIRTSLVTSPQPSEATLTGRAMELLQRIDDLASALADLTAKITGNISDSPSLEPPKAIENMIALACERVACLVGDARTLDAKL